MITLEEAVVAGVPGEWLVPEAELDDDSPAMVFLHGGGFCAGSPRTHRVFAARLCAELHATGVELPVFLPEYRLAPEHPYPAGPDDCTAVANALLEQGSRVLLAGDSAGAGLALSATVRLSEEAGCPRQQPGRPTKPGPRRPGCC